MKRFIFLLCWLAAGLYGAAAQTDGPLPPASGAEERAFWVETLVKIARPPLAALSENRLKATMPYESKATDRGKFSHLEAVGRLLCGLAPWLELGPDSTPEGRLRAEYIDLAVKGLKNAVDPASPDYLIFGEPYQPLVDAAFLAEGLLRAPRMLWGKLDKETQERVVTELKRSRAIRPWENNWLLFASTVEAALLEFTGECDRERLTYGVNRFRDEWYKGDALYGDGPAFHMDYYNSFVIHPMLTDVLRIMEKHGLEENGFLAVQERRLARYAAQLERFISPEGTFPVVGRSIVYHCGVFHALGQAALLDLLPAEIEPAQVRSALTAVIRNQFRRADNFDAGGWLRVGFAGAQLGMSEGYINTGSVYLCAVGFLALGLPPSHSFWADPFTPWTNLKAWNGTDVPADEALK